MGVTVQVRGLDREVHERLRSAAEREGVSLSAFLRARLTDLAARLEVDERVAELNSVQRALGGPFPDLSNVPPEEVVQIIRDLRDERSS